MLQPSSSGRTGRDGMSPDAEIAAYVDSLSNLTARLDEGQVSQDDLELAMHQLEALRTFLWGGIDPMVRFCVPRMLPHGPEMHPEHMEDCLKTGCDEYVVKGHRLIMRRSLDDSAVSLTDLAKEVFNPKSEGVWRLSEALAREHPVSDARHWPLGLRRRRNQEVEDRQRLSHGLPHHGWPCSDGVPSPHLHALVQALCEACLQACQPNGELRCVTPFCCLRPS